MIPDPSLISADTLANRPPKMGQTQDHHRGGRTSEVPGPLPLDESAGPEATAAAHANQRPLAAPAL
jgi:hypothetical protein